MKRHLSPVPPLLKGQEAIPPLFHRSRASLELPMMLLCKGTCAPMAPPFKGQGDSAPVMHPRSGVPVQHPHGFQNQVFFSRQEQL